MLQSGRTYSSHRDSISHNIFLPYQSHSTFEAQQHLQADLDLQIPLTLKGPNFIAWYRVDLYLVTSGVLCEGIRSIISVHTNFAGRIDIFVVF